MLNVVVDPSQSGSCLRSDVARLSGQSPGDIRLIFAGREICDDHSIKDLELAEHTVIHAVPAIGRDNSEEAGRPGLEAVLNSGVERSLVNSTGVEVEGNGTEDSMQGWKSCFHTFCKNHCRSVQRGRLRVRCNRCKDDAFLVTQDPSCWEDVLLPGRISGSCHVLGCGGHKAEFYFKCGGHSASIQDNISPLPLVRSNTRRAICITCEDVLNPVLVFPCAASHTMCLECFSQYCRLGLDERRFIHHSEVGYTLPCPAGCMDSFISDAHHFLVLGKEQYARYKRFGAEEYLLQEGGVLCPSPGCGAGILPDLDDRRVVCQQGGGLGCGFIFCRECHNAYHDGECNRPGAPQEVRGRPGSEVNPERERQARWEREESERTIERTSKPCPKCKVPVERNGGCMHMTCSRAQCKFEWCWLCGIPWNSDCLQDHWFGTGMLG
ncbi:E3 ubiquitin-protein ligase parkin-like [Diadema antillarum]|uniref:E3 ubiquitin-protein ligase parkin-like n=1 Tax=Diadema antillarum TaxID=105358 RepID=UPI003A88352C